MNYLLNWISRFFLNWIIFWIESWAKQYWIEYWMNNFLAKFKNLIESDWVSDTTTLSWSTVNLELKSSRKTQSSYVTKIASKIVFNMTNIWREKKVCNIKKSISQQSVYMSEDMYVIIIQIIALGPWYPAKMIRQRHLRKQTEIHM